MYVHVYVYTCTYFTNDIFFFCLQARSSTASTPHKISGSENSAHSGQCSTHSLQDSTHSAPPTTSAAVSSPAVAVDSDRPVPGKGEDGEEYVSEGEAPSGVSVDDVCE